MKWPFSGWTLVLLAMFCVAAGAEGRKRSPYEVPLIVNAIVNDRLEAISGEPDHFEAAIHHLVGFMMKYDSACDFLPQDIFERAKRLFSLTVEGGNAPGASAQAKFLSDAAMAGVRDATRFQERHGCGSKDAKRAIATLLKVGDKTTIGREIGRVR